MPPSLPSPAPARISADRMIFGSIIALALGVIPILALSERRVPNGIQAWRMGLCLTFLATAVAGYLLVRNGHRRPAALLLVGVIWLGVTGFAFATGIGLHSSVIYLYLVSILFTSLLCGLVPATLQTALTVAALTGLYWAEAHGWIGGIHAFMEKTTSFNYYLGVVVACVGALVVATAYQRTVERAVSESNDANARLADLNGGLEAMVAERTRELEGTVHELESFNYSVSHDLRAPLRSIHGFASRLGERLAGSLDADSRHQLERVAAEAERMDTLLMALLDFGRISRRPLKLTDLNLTAVVARIAGKLAETPDGERTRFSVQPDLRARGDRTLVIAVLESLLENAVKFSRECPEPQVEFGRAETPSGAAWYVRDNGAGFDPAFASHLYKPFHRLHADAEFSGLGMGLASARRIVERHGGRIWAEGAPGRGATFYFTLARAG